MQGLGTIPSAKLRALNLLLALAAMVALTACFVVPSGESPIVYVSDSDGDQELFLLDPETAVTTRLTNNRSPDESPRWSPNGDFIAFVSRDTGTRRSTS